MQGGQVSGADFERYRHVVIVANSADVDLEAVARQFEREVLFVFFNRPDAVVKAPFRRPSLLVLRSDVTGAMVIYKKALADAVRWLEGPDFQGLINLRVHDSEMFNRPEEFEGRPVGFMDLTTYFTGFYPEDRWPSSGFALAVWLMENVKDAAISLCGFTGRRTETQKVMDIHDWGFEQTALRSLVKAGKLRDAMQTLAGAGIASRITGRFPDLSEAAVLEAGLDVAGERLDGANRMIDRLWSTTRAVRNIDGFVRRFKPKKRKDKVLEQVKARSSSETK